MSGPSHVSVVPQQAHQRFRVIDATDVDARGDPVFDDGVRVDGHLEGNVEAEDGEVSLGVYCLVA